MNRISVMKSNVGWGESASSRMRKHTALASKASAEPAIMSDATHDYFSLP